jgi:gliding motility-associated protein GldM
MGTKNCPETPRQKMINMMYIVLTAMLALNVAAETLEAFKIIDRSLMKSYDNFTTSNKDFIDDYFREAYRNDTIKARDMLELAEIVQEETDSLINYIFELKRTLVEGVGGYEKEPGKEVPGDISTVVIEKILQNGTLQADTLVLKRQDDLNISPEIMLTKGKGKELQDSILNYRDLLVNFYKLNRDSVALYRNLLVPDVNGKNHLNKYKIIENLDLLTGKYDQQKIKIVKEALNVEDPKRDERGIDTDASLNFRTWAQENFEASPVIASISLLSKLQIDIRNAESAILRHLFDKIYESNIKVTNLKPTIIPNSNFVFQGDEYSARIFLSAEDSSLKPSVYINGSKTPLPLKNNEAIYRINTGKQGTFTFEGEIRYPFPGSDDSISNFFTQEFEVAPPQVTISPTKMNVLYKDVPGGNPISISVPAVPINRIKPKMVNGTIEPDPNNPNSWLAFPTGKADIDTAKIIVNAEVGGELRKMGEMDFRIKDVPTPITKVANKSSGTIGSNILKVVSGVYADMGDFLFDLEWEVTSFDLSVVSHGYTTNYKTTGYKFTDEQQQILQALGSGDMLMISNVKGRIRSEPGEKPKPERPLTPVILTVN